MSAVAALAVWWARDPEPVIPAPLRGPESDASELTAENVGTRVRVSGRVTHPAASIDQLNDPAA